MRLGNGEGWGVLPSWNESRYCAVLYRWIDREPKASPMTCREKGRERDLSREPVMYIRLLACLRVYLPVHLSSTASIYRFPLKELLVGQCRLSNIVTPDGGARRLCCGAARDDFLYLCLDGAQYCVVVQD